MGGFSIIQRYPSSHTRSHKSDRLFPRTLILLSAILYNPLLAIINAHIFRVNQLAPIICEGLIVSIAIIYSIININNYNRRWLYLIFIVSVFWLLLGVLRQNFDPKILRDVIIIPSFIMLGLNFRFSCVLSILIFIQIAILSIMLIELISPETYSYAFNIIDYYINSRGFDESSFWNSDSDLFISATRPNERFFPLFEAHRLSSIFLEPVSLGNYVSIITAFTVSFWRSLSLGQLAFMAISNLLLLFGCDGRLALGVAGAILIFTPIFSAKLNSYPVVIMPIVAVIAVMSVLIVQSSSYLPSQGDNLIGRLSVTLDLVQSLNIADFFGFSLDLLSSSLDSGIAYSIIAQSLIGFIILWGFIFFRRGATPAGNTFVHATALYVSATMMVSYSLYSIKTAGLVWFLFGLSISNSNSRLSATLSGSPRADSAHVAS